MLRSCSLFQQASPRRPPAERLRAMAVGSPRIDQQQQQQAGGTTAAAAAAAAAVEATATAVAPRQHWQRQQQEQQQTAPVVVRRYRPEQDHPDVVHICRNVYGGTDDLPTTINGRAVEPGTHILVACSNNSGTDGSGGGCGSGGGRSDDNGGSSEARSLDALLCCQQRGDVLWLWGARTREEARGLGLAQLLLEEAEALARSLPGVAALLSVTVPANDTMRYVFGKRGFRQQCQVISWPASEVSLTAHQQLLEQAACSAGGHQQPSAPSETDTWCELQQVHEVHQVRQQQPASLLTVLPAVAAVVDSPAARRLLPKWRRCRSSAELQELLLLLRRQRTDGHVKQQQQQSALSALQPQPSVLPPESGAFLWLPAQYELEPAGSGRVLSLIEAGQVWLLGHTSSTDASSSGGNSGVSRSILQLPALQQQVAEGPAARPPPLGVCAVLVLWGQGFRGIRHAGIVASSTAALGSAVLHAATAADPATCRFYVDCCGGFEHARLWQSTPGERYDILPFVKVLEAA